MYTLDNLCIGQNSCYWVMIIGFRYSIGYLKSNVWETYNKIIIETENNIHWAWNWFDLDIIGNNILDMIGKNI